MEAFENTRFETKSRGTGKLVGVTYGQDITPANLSRFYHSRIFYQTAKRMAEKSTLTKQSIFEMLEGFSKYYDIMTPEDKKALLQAMISYIELYGEKRTDGHFVKAIHFTFPVTYDGESGALFVRTNEQQVESVMLLSNLSGA